MGGMGRIKGERSERQSDTTENHHQHRLYLSLFDVEKVRFVIQNALWQYSELWFLYRRGEHFQINHEKEVNKFLVRVCFETFVLIFALESLDREFFTPGLPS